MIFRGVWPCEALSTKRQRKLKTSLKTCQVFLVHSSAEEFKNVTLCGHFGFVKTRAGKSRDYADFTVFGKLCFKMFSIITEVLKSLRFHIPPVSIAFSKALLW